MAHEFYVKMKGKKQGDFKGESIRKEWDKWMTGLSFEYSVQAPRDIATGQASGKRQHSPVIFTKEWGASSPLLLQALVTNEILENVEFDFIKTDPSGKEIVYYVIKLTNATVSKLVQSTHRQEEGGAKHEAAYDVHELEQVSLTFQKIEVEDKVGKTSALDDWKS